LNNIPPKLPSKEELLKELEAGQASEKDLNVNAPYTCTRCNRPNNFNYTMKFIKDTGMCPLCYHEEQDAKDLRDKNGAK